MTEPRSAASSGAAFPYRDRTVCYIEVATGGAVTDGAGRDAYLRARAGESRLFAVWPGQHRSDLFVIDDLDAYAKALNIIHDPKRTGLADHEHRVRWSLGAREDNPKGAWVAIDVRLDCGCQIRDIAAFAAQMKAQRGWDIPTSTGWGGGGGSYSMRVRRKSL
jgi:hypothetical protein